LIVWDPASNLGLYSTGQGADVFPGSMAVTLSNRETALGFTPTTVSSYANFVAMSDAQIAQYAHIWDIGYDTSITNAAALKYQTYLQGGGALFLLGENGSFFQRDNTITNFITFMGGGSIATNNGHYYGQAVIQNQFLLANNNANVEFFDVANFVAFGSGTPMIITNSGLNVATVWKTGSLTNAPTGAICSILDVNWLDGFIGNTVQPNLIDNISIVLNKA
jgi:hypothetical protein